ncbi:MAG: DNA polymerase III subunit delta' [Burkholderiaceae bacterium]|jgi:DNA polymerase-3 subunit delta'
MKEELYPWQANAWREACGWIERLPGAILFFGPKGIGKVTFAREFGRALLCENPGPLHRPCGHCNACTWIAGGNHPDYRLVRPQATEIAEGAEDSDEGLNEGAVEDAGGPADGESAKSRRAPSKEIRIQQVRSLAEALSISSHQGGRRVVILYPADAMNVYTANALLKMLEEPPPGTVYLLVTDAPERLLPTILSRCRRFALSPPDPEAALTWLNQQGVVDAALVLAESGGTPLAALAASSEAATMAPFRDALFEVLKRPDGAAALQAAERLAKCDLSLVAGWIQRWVYDCIGYRLAQRIRYYPSEKAGIAALCPTLDLGRCLAYARVLAAERKVVEHPLNPRLFVENLLLGYCRALQIS